MKALILIAALVLAPLAQATPASDTKAAVMKDPAVRGALAHAKRASGAKSCDDPKFTVKDGQFEAWVYCNNPGDPEESKRLGYGTESSGILHILGTDLGNGAFMFERIEFDYAG